MKSKGEGTRFSRVVPGWRIEQDVVGKRGMMLLTQGSELSVTAILALRNLHAAAGAIGEPLLVSYGMEAGAGSAMAGA